MNDDSEAKCSRMKYWSECDDSEKIARLREKVKDLQRTVKRQTTAIDKLLRHFHAGDKIVIDIEDNRNDYPAEHSYRDDETYF